MKPFQAIFQYVKMNNGPVIPSAPTTQGLQILSSQEIKCVAGAPEATVGTGINPP